MPIECNQINKECPKCKNATMFETNKGFFCNKCLTGFDPEMKEIIVNEKNSGCENPLDPALDISSSEQPEQKSQEEIETSVEQGLEQISPITV